MAKVILSLEGNAAKAVAALTKTIAKQREMLSKVKEIDRASKKAEKAGLGAAAAHRKAASAGGFAASASNRLTAGFSGAAVAGMVMNQLRQVVTTMEAEIKRAGQLIRETFLPLQDLIQISDTLLEFQQFRATGQRFTAATGVRQPRGLALAFDAKSLGLLKELGEIGKVTGFSDPGGFIQSISKFVNVAGEEATGTPREFANQLLFAAKESAVNVKRLVPAAIGPAAIGDIIGASPQEVLAVIAVAVKATKVPERASTAIDALGRLINKNKLGGGQGFLAGLAALEALPEAERDKLIGSEAEALKGYVILKRGRAEVERVLKGTLLAQTLSGTELSEINKKRAIVETDPSVRALRDARLAAAREEITATATRGLIDLEKQTIRDRQKIIQDFLGLSELKRFPIRAATEVALFFGARPVQTELFRMGLPDFEEGLTEQEKIGVLVEQIIQRQITALDRNTAAIEAAGNGTVPVLEP